MLRATTAILKMTGLCPVVYRHHAGFVGAMGAAKELPFGFNAVAYYPAFAMFANRGQGVDGAFETIEVMRRPVHHDFQRLVIVVPADFTSCHRFPFH
jgi:hypothetical protein